MPAPRIVIEQGENGDVRIYNTNYVICPNGTYQFSHPLRPGSRDTLVAIGRVASSIVQLLIDAPGVVGLRTARYFVSVAKGTAWDWEDIEPLVLQTIGEHAGVETLDVTYLPGPPPPQVSLASQKQTGANHPEECDDHD